MKIVCVSYLIWSYLVVIEGEDVVICYHISNPVRTIDCGSDAIIQIHSITAALVFSAGECNPTVVINTIRTRKSEHKRNVNPSVGCHGSQRCDIPAYATEMHLPGTILSTNVLHVNYDCFQLTETSVARLPLYQDVTARNLHIFSPVYPHPMPKGMYSFQCIVTTVRTATHLNILIERLKMSQLGQCFEELRLSGNSHFCSILEQNVYRREIMYENGTLIIIYEKAEGPLRQGGYFWLHITGFQGEEPVDLKIACPDQSAVPGYSTVPLPVTTVTATVTRTVAVTIKSEGSDLGFASDTGDEKSSGSILPGVTGALAGLVLITVIIIVVLYLKLKKRGTMKKTESQNQANTTEDGMTHRDETNIQLTTEYAEISEAAHSYENTPGMFAAPVVKRYENFPQNASGNTINASMDLEEYEYVSNSKAIDKEENNYKNDKEPSTYEVLKAETKEVPDVAKDVYAKLEHNSAKRSSVA